MTAGWSRREYGFSTGMVRISRKVGGAFVVWWEFVSVETKAAVMLVTSRMDWLTVPVSVEMSRERSWTACSGRGGL